MDWKYLLTSFEGRISRQPFWLSVLVLFIAQWVIMIVAGMVFGFSMMSLGMAFYFHFSENRLYIRRQNLPLALSH